MNGRQRIFEIRPIRWLIEQDVYDIIQPESMVSETMSSLRKVCALAEVRRKLVAPHHGHRNLSTVAFLDAVQPRYVLFATGYRNRFGYPRPETVARYQATGATLLNASDEGALTFRLEPGQSLAPERYRREHRHYWTAP